MQSNSGSDVTKPRNPAFSPAVNIQFFEPPLKCHGPKPLILASACLWTLSKLSMSFLCLDPDLAQSGFQMELNLDCAERAWSAPAQTLNLGICSSACHRLLFFFIFLNPRAYGQSQSFVRAVAVHVRSLYKGMFSHGYLLPRDARQ